MRNLFFSLATFSVGTLACPLHAQDLKRPNVLLSRQQGNLVLGLMNCNYNLITIP